MHWEGCGVAIALRKNNIGKRFGFARFIEVVDARLLVVSLDNVFVDGEKIYVNIPRFQCNGREEDGRRAGGVRPEGNRFTVPRKRFQTLNKIGFMARRGDKSYAETIANHQLKVSQSGNHLLKFTPKQAEKRILNKAFVGRVIILGSTYCLQASLEMEGYYAVKVSPLGPLLCLLEESGEGFIKGVVEEDKCGGRNILWR